MVGALGDSRASTAAVVTSVIVTKRLGARKAACDVGNSDDEPLGGHRLEQGCLDRRDAHFERSDGINKIVSARCQHSGEQRVCDI